MYACMYVYCICAPHKRARAASLRVRPGGQSSGSSMHACVRACVRACVCACVRACARACVRVGRWAREGARARKRVPSIHHTLARPAAGACSLMHASSPGRLAAAGALAVAMAAGAAAVPGAVARAARLGATARDTRRSTLLLPMPAEPHTSRAGAEPLELCSAALVADVLAAARNTRSTNSTTPAAALAPGAGAPLAGGARASPADIAAPSHGPSTSSLHKRASTACPAGVVAAAPAGDAAASGAHAGAARSDRTRGGAGDASSGGAGGVARGRAAERAACTCAAGTPVRGPTPATSRLTEATSPPTTSTPVILANNPSCTACVCARTHACQTSPGHRQAAVAGAHRQAAWQPA